MYQNIAFNIIGCSGFLKLQEMNNLALSSKKDVMFQLFFKKLKEAKQMNEMCEKLLSNFEYRISGSPQLEGCMQVLMEKLSNLDLKKKHELLQVITAMVFCNFNQPKASACFSKNLHEIILKFQDASIAYEFLKNHLNVPLYDYGDHYRELALERTLTVKVLIKKGKGIYTAENDTAYTEAVVKMGADPNGRPEGKKIGRALKYCLQNDRLQHFRYLIAQGANVEICYNEMGETLLHYLAGYPNNCTDSRNYVENFQEVFKYLPNPFIKNENGKTPLEVARVPSYYDNGISTPVKVKLLEDYEALFLRTIREIHLIVKPHLFDIEPLAIEYYHSV